VRTRSAFPGTTSGARALATALLALLATRTLATALLAGPRRPLLRGTAAHAERVVADPRRTRTRPGRLGLGRDNTGLAGAAARLGTRLRAGLGDRLGTGLGSFGSRRRLSRLARRLRTRLRSWFRARLRPGLGSLRRRRFGLRARLGTGLGASLGALGRLSAVAILALRRLGECVTQSARHRGLHGGGRRLDVLALLGELVQYFLAGYTELFRELMHAGLACHCSPRLGEAGRQSRSTSSYRRCAFMASASRLIHDGSTCFPSTAWRGTDPTSVSL